VLLASSVCGAPAQQFSFSHYGQDEGLRNLDVFGLVEDNSGMLWLATENGLFRYNGAIFQHFGPREGIGESLVLGLHKDNSGRIWVVTNDHLYYLENNRFLPAPTGASPAQFGAGAQISSIDPRHILLLVRGTLMLISREDDEESWKAAPFFTPEETAANPSLMQIHSVFAAGSDTGGRSLWLGCGQAICHVLAPLERSRVEVFSRLQGIPSEPWVRFFEDRGGTLWARSRSSIRVMAAGESSFRPRDLPQGNGAEPYQAAGIIAIAQDRQGAVLTQTNRGIARWEGGSWRIFDSSNGVDLKDVSAILFDNRGIPWFSTRGHGIARWRGYNEVENWTIAQGLHDDVVWSIFRSSSHDLWIADQFQANRLDAGTRRLDTPDLLHKVPVLHGTGFSESPDGSLWVFSIDGEVLHTDAKVEHVLFRTRLPAIARIFTDSSHRIWILSRNGLYVIRGPRSSIEKISNPILANEAFADAAESPNHDLWFLSDRYLYSLPHDENRYQRIELDPAATRGQMRNIAAAPDGSLWIGGGIPALLHLRADGPRVRELESIGTPKLASTDVQIVRFDTRGWLWVGTDMGIQVFDGFKWRRLTRRDGLISNDIDEGAFLADEDGSVWIGANGGAVHLLHPADLFSREPLNIRLLSASLGGEPLSLTSTSSVPWKDAPLDINFTTLNFAREGSVHFRYRLSGMEFEWSDTGSRTLHYPAVSPGDYRFELQAVDSDQQKQSQIVSFSFTIRPPWWRTRAMYLVLGILSFIASILVWHWRERRLLDRQKMLRQLVAQRTRELEAEKAELMAAREALSHQATRDALTGVWNRPAIIEILVREMERARRSGATLAVVLADIDHFKQINDTYGHLAGDIILRDVARRMTENIRPYDFLGRYGGEEFLLVMPGLPLREPHPRLQHLLESISRHPFAFDDHEVFVTSSFGVAWYDRANTAVVEDLIRRADEALYSAKAKGRNQVVFHEDPKAEEE
jgi:diguanylate cyclase (GGDEF)-like protein